jgi:hypothetical protein
MEGAIIGAARGMANDGNGVSVARPEAGFTAGTKKRAEAVIIKK